MKSYRPPRRETASAFAVGVSYWSEDAGCVVNGANDGNDVDAAALNQDEEGAELFAALVIHTEILSITL
jgi:hypothetical protein